MILICMRYGHIRNDLALVCDKQMQINTFLAKQQIFLENLIRLCKKGANEQNN